MSYKVLQALIQGSASSCVVVSGLGYCIVLSGLGSVWWSVDGYCVVVSGLGYCVVVSGLAYSGELAYCVVVSRLTYCVALSQSLSKDNLFKDNTVLGLTQPDGYQIPWGKVDSKVILHYSLGQTLQMRD